MMGWEIPMQWPLGIVGDKKRLNLKPVRDVETLIEWALCSSKRPKEGDQGPEKKILPPPAILFYTGLLWHGSSALLSLHIQILISSETHSKTHQQLCEARHLGSVQFRCNLPSQPKETGKLSCVDYAKIILGRQQSPKENGLTEPQKVKGSACCWKLISKTGNSRQRSL